MAVINQNAVHTTIDLKYASVPVAPVTIAANDTLRIAVPLQGAFTTHFANATFGYNNINLSLTAKSSLNVVYVFITNHSSEPITTTSSTLSVAIHR